MGTTLSSDAIKGSTATGEPPLPEPSGLGWGTCAEVRSTWQVSTGPGWDWQIAALPNALGGVDRVIRHEGPLELEGLERRVPRGELATVLVRFDVADAAVWGLSFEGTLSSYVREMAPGPAGSVYVAGSSDGLSTLGGVPLGGAGDIDGWLARVGPDGAVMWIEHLTTQGYERVEHVVAMPDGGVAVAALMEREVGLGGASARPLEVVASGASTLLLARYTAEGVPIWARTISGGFVHPEGLAYAADHDALAVLGEGDVLDFGSDAPPGQVLGRERFVAWYGAQGSLGWVRSLGYLGLRSMSMAGTGAGELFVVGGVHDRARLALGSPMERVLDEKETPGWLMGLSPTGGARFLEAGPEAAAVATSDGQVWVYGGISGPVVVGPRQPDPVRWEEEGAGAYVARFDHDGVLRCAVRLDYAEGRFSSVRVVPRGRDLAVMGTVYGTVGLGDTTLVAGSESDAFEVVLSWQVP